MLSTSTIRKFFRKPVPLVAILISGVICYKNANAGTGYIGSDGRWNFTVAFYQSTAAPIPSGVISDWTALLNTADAFLYKSTGGVHRFGNITFVAGPNYDPTVDVVVNLNARHDPFADVYGLKRLGYHVFISDQWRIANPTRVVPYLIHELGHYLYSLFDEYVDCNDPANPQQCIYLSDECFEQNACMMEGFSSEHKFWCYSFNHERKKIASPPLQLTWQSQANNGESCWSTMRRIYNPPAAADVRCPPPFSPAVPPSFLPEPTQCPGAVSSPSPPLTTPIVRNQHIELVIAIERSLCPTVNDPICIRIKQMLDRIFVSSRLGLPGGVSFLVFDGNQVVPSGPVQWNNALVMNYDSFLDPLLNAVSPTANDDIELLLQNVISQFESLSTAGGVDPAVGAVTRTFLLLTQGTEAPSLLPSSTTLDNFNGRDIRTTMGFLNPENAVLCEFINLSRDIGAVFYDITAPNVQASQANDAANKQTVYLETKTISQGGSIEFRFAAPEVINSAFVAVAWSDPACQLDVVLLRNGDPGPPLGSDEQNDLIGHAIKGRRYLQIGLGEEFTAKVNSSCIAAPFSVTFSIADEEPKVVSTVNSQRNTYGQSDSIVVNFRALDPFPIKNVDSLVVGEIDNLGNFISEISQRAVDNGNVLAGDWVAGDGIYSAFISGVDRSILLHTVRIIAINFGGAVSVDGEILPDSTLAVAGIGQDKIPFFRREGFATFYVDPTNTTLPVSVQFDIGDTLVVSNDSIRVTGTLGLASDYPHAFSINGTIAGGAVINSMKIDANTFDADIRVDTLLSDIMLTASLEVLYRTSDKRMQDAQKIFHLDRTTGVKEKNDSKNDLPKAFRLYGNFPNPFNISTRIAFDVPKSSKISLVIYDVTGRIIRTLIDDPHFSPGRHEVIWDGRMNNGEIAGSGLYFVQMRAADFEQVQKIMLIK